MGIKALHLRKGKIFCNTRWAGEHTSFFFLFGSLFRVTVHYLEIIMRNDDKIRK